MSKYAQQIGILRSDCGDFDVESNLPKKKKRRKLRTIRTFTEKKRVAR